MNFRTLVFGMFVYSVMFGLWTFIQGKRFQNSFGITNRFNYWIQFCTFTVVICNPFIPNPRYKMDKPR